MDRAVIGELHYMTPIANLASIRRYGILSHVRAAALPHASVALEAVQDRRANKRIPGGRALHEYANLYFDARNAMMFMRRSDELVVVRVSSSVLDLPGTVVSDGNAANGVTRFFPSPAGIDALDADRVYAEWWTHEDYWEQQERKRQRQAEVLVPEAVTPDLIIGCYAWREQEAQQCRSFDANWSVEVNAHVYFC